MYTTLLFKESPLISVVVLLHILYFTYNSSKYMTELFIVILVFLIFMYRYKPHRNNYPNNVIISPTQGKITNITHKHGIIHVSIYMNLLNTHTQIYPTNGRVIGRYYDKTGKFELITNKEKSRHNEKKIHVMLTDGKYITVTQIAGFIPRCIVASDKYPEDVRAGQYLGMIKFGSRIDVAFPGDPKKLKVKLNDNVEIGNLMYSY